MTILDSSRADVGDAPDPPEQVSPATANVARLSLVWGVVWTLVGLFLLINDLAGLDVLWDGTADSGAVGVLVLAIGATVAAFGWAAMRALAWAYTPLYATYVTLVPIGILWLFRSTSLVYGVIHTLVWGAGLYFVRQEAVRDDLAGPRFSSIRNGLLGGFFAGVILGLLFTFSGPKIVTTMVGVVVSIAAAGAVFVGINRLFDTARTNWQLFMAMAWGLAGFFIGGLLVMNGVPGGALTILLVIAIGAALGWWRGGQRDPSLKERNDLITKARTAIFVVPALLFIGVSLVIPTIRTVFLSLFNSDSSEFVGLRNYGWVFTNDTYFSVDGFSGIFGSNMTILGGILLAIGFGYGAVMGSRRGGGLELSNGISATAVGLGIMFIALAIFTSLRGAIWNNAWWVAAVTGFSTALGLLIAVIADKIKYEAAAKSLIFLPMAISMVGAGVIWGFIYDFSTRGDQVGLLNAIWSALGNDPVFWLGERPWNNFLLIIVMIWIQTGFAMVVLSAALKGVPDDQVEAARVDGASEVDVFWRITVPTIRSTIAVVVTTLIILVMKVYDIVKVMTNGEFGTEVLANAMFNQAFTFVSFGRGSALATILFLAVAPMMYVNIRRVRQEQAIR